MAFAAPGMAAPCPPCPHGPGRATNVAVAAVSASVWRTDGGLTGFDLTFSAPKSVSALWALGDPAAAAEAMAAHRAAVRAALAYLDTHAALSRRGTDGTEQVGSAGLVAAVFDHRSSRAGDPRLHTHALVLNKVRCSDGRWRTLMPLSCSITRRPPE